VSEAGFDVLETLDELKSAGFNEAQTRALTQALQGVVSARQGELATKADLAATRGELKADVADLRAALKTDVFDLRAELKGDIADLRAELKGDIADLRAELKSDIADLRAELKADISGLETRLLKAINDQQRWTIGVMLVLVGVVFAAIRLV